MEYLKFLGPWIWLISSHSPAQFTIKSLLFQAKIRPSTDGNLIVYDDVFYVLINVNDSNVEFHSISLREVDNVQMFKVYYEVSTELGTLVPLTDDNNKTVRMKCVRTNKKIPTCTFWFVCCCCAWFFCHRFRSKRPGTYCFGLSVCLQLRFLPRS